MLREAEASCRHRRVHGAAMVPLSPEEAEAMGNFPPAQPISMLSSTLSASSVSPSSSPLSSPSSGFSSTSSSSSALTSSFSPSPWASMSSPPLSQRRTSSSERRRRSKPTRGGRLPKPFSEPAIPSLQESMARESASKEGITEPHPAYRRCMTDTDFKAIQGVPSQAAPDLLQLFNIFQFNKPENPPARMLVNVTLVGSIQSVRLLVAYDASVQDVIKASLKGYVKEGRLPHHCAKNQTYGLHYSPFCLESIDPSELISSLGTRSFYLFPRVDQPSNPTQNPKGGKPWWDILSLLSS